MKVYFLLVTRSEIVDRIARERRVETMLTNIAKRPLDADLEDLSQMTYLTLLEFDEEKLTDLWEHNQINFFIARILLNQFRSAKSPFYGLFRRWQRREVRLDKIPGLEEFTEDDL